MVDVSDYSLFSQHGIVDFFSYITSVHDILRYTSILSISHWVYGLMLLRSKIKAYSLEFLHTKEYVFIFIYVPVYSYSLLHTTQFRNKASEVQAIRQIK